MTNFNKTGQSQSITAGGDMIGVAMGNENTISVDIRKASLPEAGDVNIQNELNRLQEILASLDDPITIGVAQKIKTEASKSQPDKSTVEKTLEMGLNYATDLAGFAEAIEKLRPHVEATASWLGKNGYKLLPLVGLAI